MLSAPGDGAGPPRPIVDLRTCLASAVLALNNAHHVETSPLDDTGYGLLIEAAGFAAAVGDRPDAFLIAFSDTSEHVNDNLAWFRERHRRFFYVDRVIVAGHARGRGLARALYGALIERARLENRPVIGCEINVTPPNPASDALHQGLGFAEIARRQTGPDKVIRYMRLAL